MSGFQSGPRKRPAFDVRCVAKAIIHGTLNNDPESRATLLIYDFSFFSYRSTRIKEADIFFEFVDGKNSSQGSAPTVKRIAPYSRHSMMETTQTNTKKLTADAGIDAGSVVTANTKVGVESSTEKITTHAAEIVGSQPFDNWGNYTEAQWHLKENDSQQNGIVAMLRSCILLTRDNDEEFECVPYIRVSPNFSTWLGSLASTRSRDDAIPFDPSFEPFSDLDGKVEIDRWNLNAVDLEQVWDCTFSTTFGNAVKSQANS